MTGSLGRDYFESVYAHDDDPWRFETAWYERRKQALTLALLPKERYECVFEPGCASGELTRLLSARAKRVLALELMPRIAARASQRLEGVANIEVRTGAIPDDWPHERFDLILLSEVAYYLDAEGLSTVARMIDETLEPGGQVVAVHYLGETDYPLPGRRVQELLQAQLSYDCLATHSERDFSAVVLQK